MLHFKNQYLDTAYFVSVCVPVCIYLCNLWGRNTNMKGMRGIYYVVGKILFRIYIYAT